MHVERIPNEQKLDHRDLLLLADEQWDLVERYLERGDMWALVEEGEVRAECVVTEEGDGLCEVKNLAVAPSWQRRGYGRMLVAHVQSTYAGRFSRLRICTGDSPLTVPFYESCGLAVVRRDEGYFLRTYDHPIFEAGKQLTDLVVLEQDLWPYARPRTVITTDGEVDDQNSLIRALLYANDMDIAGIVLTSSVFHYAGDPARGIEPFRWTGSSWPFEMIDRYEACYGCLCVHDARYPEPSYLRERTKIGNFSYKGEMDEVTEGSEFLVRLFLDDDPRTLYVQTWGGTNTTARALKTIEERYAGSPEWPALQRRLSQKLVIYLILDQDESYADYIAPHWPDIQVLNDTSNFWHFAYAWQLHPDELNTTLHAAWEREHIAFAKGALAERYALMGDGKWLDGELPEEQRGSDGYLAAHPEWERYDFISEGDSPSFLYLVDKGLRSLEDPTFGGWGGRFSADGRNMVADYDPWSGRFEASHTLTRWLDDLQGDFAARLQWCTASRYEEANHAPELRVIEGYDMLAQPGERVCLTCEARDPDGDGVSVGWWHYAEVGTYASRWMPHELEDVMVADMVLDRTASPAKGKEPWVLQLTGADQRAVSFVVPSDARPGDTFHIIAEATDDAPLPMKAYRRVIVTVR